SMVWEDRTMEMTTMTTTTTTTTKIVMKYYYYSPNIKAHRCGSYPAHAHLQVLLTISHSRPRHSQFAGHLLHVRRSDWQINPGTIEIVPRETAHDPRIHKRQEKPLIMSCA